MTGKDEGLRPKAEGEEATGECRMGAGRMLTTVLAIWGAAVATFLGIIRILDWVDRRYGRIVPEVRNFIGRDRIGPVPEAAYVALEVVNDGKKKVKIAGLELRVGKHIIDLTAKGTGDENLTIVSEGDDWFPLVRRDRLIEMVRKETGQRPPYACEAAFLSKPLRWHKKRFVLDNEGVHSGGIDVDSEGAHR